MRTSALEWTLRRDRAVVGAGIALVVALAWLYLLLGAGMDMGALREAAERAMGGGQPLAWTIGYAAIVFVMWAVMMLAMMLPSAAPMILLYGTVSRRQREQGYASVGTGVFAAGYVVAWTGFSLAATALQWGLERLSLLSPMMASTSDVLGGVILVAAGLYQMTPLKHACLRHCRSPLSFLVHRWRSGPAGAFRMGLEHGLFCLGCCWVLMGLLFVGGVMNLLWIAGIAVFVLMEKVAPAGSLIARASGPLLVAAGGAVLVM